MPGSPGGGVLDEGRGSDGAPCPASRCYECEQPALPACTGSQYSFAFIDSVARTSYRRYGADMIYLKLRQHGLLVNHKCGERLYGDAQLQVRKRKRKKVPMGERQPLTRPNAANEVWSMDFVFDRSADTRVIKSLTIVDNATHESVAIVPERAIGGLAVTHILD